MRAASSPTLNPQIEPLTLGEDKLIHFSGVAMGEACTIVLRGASALHLLPILNPQIQPLTLGEDKFIHFPGVPMSEACIIVLRGASESCLSPVLPFLLRVA